MPSLRYYDWDFSMICNTKTYHFHNQRVKFDVIFFWEEDYLRNGFLSLPLEQTYGYCDWSSVVPIICAMVVLVLLPSVLLHCAPMWCYVMLCALRIPLLLIFCASIRPTHISSEESRVSDSGTTSDDKRWQAMTSGNFSGIASNSGFHFDNLDIIRQFYHIYNWAKLEFIFKFNVITLLYVCGYLGCIGLWTWSCNLIVIWMQRFTYAHNGSKISCY